MKKIFAVFKRLTISCILILLFISNGLLLTSCSNKPSGYLEIHTIDVGQGDSSLIISPDGHSLLVDGGEEEYARNVIRHIKKSHINHLDYVIGTHFDSDHIGSLDKVVSEIPTSNIYLPPDKSSKKDLLEIISVSRSKTVNMSPLRAGDEFKLGDSLSIYILSPKHISDETNENSIVFLMKYKLQYFLFTGDASSQIESQVLSDYDLPHLDFLKVGHHGSKYSSAEDFLSTTKPKISTISCGYGNSYGHPHQETLDRLHTVGSKIYRTDLNGDMVFYFDGTKTYTKNRYEFE